MSKLPFYIDLETYSDKDLKKHSAYSYSESPQFEIMMAAYAFGDDPVEVIFGHDEIMATIGHALLDPDVEKIAHNAPFERICLSRLTCLPGEFLPPEEWTDTQALAAEWGYPQKLLYLAKWLGTELKDEAGTALINWFCKPDRNGNRRRPEDHPEKWAQFVEYCRQDVVALRDIHKALPDWPNATEFAVWCADQRINDNGIPVDLPMVQKAISAAEDNQAEQRQEVTDISGVKNPGSVQQLAAYFSDQGLELPDMTKDTIEAALAGELPNEEVRRVLELRQELALVASKKYIAALDRTSAFDARLRGSFKFFGAHTGRWSGSGVQLQNLPSATLWGKDEIDEDDHAGFDEMTSGAIGDLMAGMPLNANDLKALVRSMFTGPFNVVDYSAIEARVVSWLAGEQWALDAFAEGRDIYVETAERMSTPSKPLGRKQGKVAVLALGYNGGINSLRAMGADGTDDELRFLVGQWRDANQAIVGMWHEMDAVFRTGGTVGNWLTVEKDGADRYIRLPSGRVIGYHNCKLRWTVKWEKRVQEVTFMDPKPPARMQVATYGGRLVENVTQAVARDILAEALVRLVQAGKEVVGHVHDEILTRGPEEDLPEITRLMVQQPTWAPGLPLAAEGFPTKRYRKG